MPTPTLYQAAVLVILLAIIIHSFEREEKETVEQVILTASIRDKNGDEIERKKHKLSYEEYKETGGEPMKDSPKFPNHVLSTLQEKRMRVDIP
jgi:hypothetical protein